jgi:hypothetical protein
MKESSGVVEMKEKKRVAEMGRKTDNVAVTVNYRYLLSLEPSLLGGMCDGGGDARQGGDMVGGEASGEGTCGVGNTEKNEVGL